MNNELNEDQLESLLRGLAPAAASPALRHRVDEELKLDMNWLSTRRPTRRAPRWLTSASWAAMGAAAAIAVMSYLPQASGTHEGAGSMAAVVVPATTTTHESNEYSDYGSNQVRNRVPEKRALVISRELQTWVDPRYAAETTMEIPSHQQLFLPASFR